MILFVHYNRRVLVLLSLCRGTATPEPVVDLQVSTCTRGKHRRIVSCLSGVSVHDYIILHRLTANLRNAQEVVISILKISLFCVTTSLYVTLVEHLFVVF